MITTNISGTLRITKAEGGKLFIQFVPDDPEAVTTESLSLEGNAQLLRTGQFEFIAKKFNNLMFIKR